MSAHPLLVDLSPRDAVGWQPHCRCPKLVDSQSPHAVLHCMKKCSKCKETKELSSFNKHSARKDGLQTFCRDCERMRKKKYYQEHPEKFLKYNQKKRQRAKTWLNGYKASHPCVVCGESCIPCLDFHHIHDKVSGIGAILCEQRSIPKLAEEIKKCVVLCANCHRKLHAGLIQLPATVQSGVDAALSRRRSRVQIPLVGLS